MEWDVFISHASEDKDSFVRELAESLKSYGVKVWYDEFTLKIGDSLTESINKGLINSNYGIVVLSNFFLAKRWPDYEMKSLLTKEISGSSVILPVWYNVTKEEMEKYNLYLADKYSFDARKMNIDTIVIELIKVIRPDIFKSYKDRILYDVVNKKNSFRSTIDTRQIKRTIKHNNFSLEVLIQIKLLQEVFYDILPISFTDHVFGFMTEDTPEREITVWNRIAATYLQWLRQTNKTNDLVYKHQLKTFLFRLSAINKVTEIEGILKDYDIFLINYTDGMNIFKLYNNIVTGIDKQDCNIYAYLLDSSESNK